MKQWKQLSEEKMWQNLAKGSLGLRKPIKFSAIL